MILLCTSDLPAMQVTEEGGGRKVASTTPPCHDATRPFDPGHPSVWHSGSPDVRVTLTGLELSRAEFLLTWRGRVNT